MLEIGNGGMTLTEYQSHMSLWAISKAPLIIGCDVRNISNEYLEILANSEVIAVNQDTLGLQAKKIRIDVNNNTEIWSGLLSDGSKVVLAFNRDDSHSRTTFVSFDELGWPTSTRVHVRDLWLQKDLGEFQDNYTASDIPSHGVQMLKMTRLTS